MDVDLQDPPEVILSMVKKWEEGFELVHAVRQKRLGDSFFKKVSAYFFYFFINLISSLKFQKNSSDFKLIDQRVIKRLRQYKGRLVFMKGLLVHFSHSQGCVYYERQKRSKGKTSWNVFQLLNLALDGVVFSTTLPIRIWFYSGVLLSSLSFLYAFFIIYLKLFTDIVPHTGYASIIVTILLTGGLCLSGIATTTEYIARIYNQVNGMPLYLIKEIVE